MDAEARRTILQTVRAVLEREADAMLAAARSTREAATHEDAKPENDKDTRALEAGYLAGAQAERVRELRAAIAALAATPIRAAQDDEVVALGSLVETCFDERGVERRQWYLVAPDGGGVKIAWQGNTVSVVTPRSPIGRALLGRRVGDAAGVATERGVREIEVCSVE